MQAFWERKKPFRDANPDQQVSDAARSHQHSEPDRLCDRGVPKSHGDALASKQSLKLVRRDRHPYLLARCDTDIAGP
jgi:hypothetical protein